MSSAADRYSPTAVALHWLLAVLIIVSFAVGVYMVDLPFSPSRLKLFNWHKWAGFVVLALSALRLLWRLTHRPPHELPAPAWQQFAAQAAHGALYLLFFAVPLVGWAYTSATGFPLVPFGLVQLPDFVPVNQELAEAMKAWHKYLSYGMGVLVVMHTAAALKHHFVDRDGTMARMGLRGRTA
jgi:cytochrome b561